MPQKSQRNTSFAEQGGPAAVPGRLSITTLPPSKYAKVKSYIFRWLSSLRVDCQMDWAEMTDLTHDGTRGVKCERRLIFRSYAPYPPPYPASPNPESIVLYFERLTQTRF